MRETRVLVRVAHSAVASGTETLCTLGLGSCVAVLLHDPEARVAGMAHCLLPAPRRGYTPENPAKFVSTAVPALLAEMEARGAERARVTARLVGGATMFGSLLAKRTVHTGARNVAMARSVLAAEGVPLVGEEVGKEHGRSVHFHAADGRVVVSSYRGGEVIL